MTRPPTAAQRRTIEAAEPVTGRLTGTQAQLAALVKRGLAFRHPRPPHDHFLTPVGHRVRETAEVVETVEVAEAASPVPAAPAETGVFAARVGGEEAAEAGPARIREVRSAWQGLLELRRMTDPGGATDRPCTWERTHLVQAAALALEAAGHRPATAATAAAAAASAGAGAGAGAPTNGGGYRVRATPQPEAVAVRESDAEALRACAVTLEQAGWQVGEHTDPRTRERYLLASPRRA
ncbi:hypothetical protein [Streptomyces sp. NPDC012510]|uniref:hypothetical protein n=1 Tax=Streptomyces sp. NPDC012510 TaxID=3364838 RepID=UPI0036F12477